MTDLRHDPTTFQGRTFNFMRMTNPMNLIAGEAEIMEEYSKLKDLENQEKQGH